MLPLLADHQQLRGGIYFVESLPMTPSGKILRRIVKRLSNCIQPTKNKIRQDNGRDVKADLLTLRSVHLLKDFKFVWTLIC